MLSTARADSALATCFRAQRIYRSLPFASSAATLPRVYCQPLARVKHFLVFRAASRASGASLGPFRPRARRPAASGPARHRSGCWRADGGRPPSPASCRLPLELRSDRHHPCAALEVGCETRRVPTNDTVRAYLDALSTKSGELDHRRAEPLRPVLSRCAKIPT